MHALKRWCCLCFMLLSVTGVYAQQAPPAISLKTLLEKVNQNAPSLVADSALIGIKQAQSTETHNNWLPNLRLNYQADVGTNNNTAGPYFGFGIVPSNSRGVRTQSNNSAVLTNLGIAALEWEVYNFGAYAAQNRVATAEVDSEEKKFAQAKYNLQAYTIGYYLQLLRLQDYLDIQAHNIKRNEQIRRSIQSLAKSGVRPGVDTSLAEAELSKSRLNYIELDNQLKQVQLKLSAISGLAYEGIVPDTTVEQALIAQMAAPAQLDADTAGHPAIGYYQSLLNASLQKEALVKKQYNPKIFLEGAYWGRGSSVDANDNFNALSTGWGFSRGNYLVGVGISYNLFDIRRKNLKRNTQRAATTYARKKLDEEKNLVALGLSQADVELNTARRRLQEIPNQLKAATAGYRQKLSLYKSGLTDIIELNAALNILYRAETDYAQAKYAYTSALFQKAVTGNRVNTVLNLLN
ncbi:TolC family protein [Mucilaginibacter pedocola]|uniref:Transporter n=1 Tax=Mucilaginibacter pedocola TaxID=1792845 RepID=A0A1S9PCQ9_9SPHI|nr:TolC family protein [Mucilaginibacter pedocola]OOQ58729.1 transporter [Mucilaginibacter pedocola]